MSLMWFFISGEFLIFNVKVKCNLLYSRCRYSSGFCVTG
jgi:hypothetical protein